MKKLPSLINFVAYGFALFLFLYVLRVLFHLYVFSHLPGASSYLPDPALYTQDRVFVYTKRFAELAHLDPTKAIELSPGLEAIEFESGQAIESADIFYPVDYFNIRSDSDRRIVDMAGSVLEKLHPNHIEHSRLLSCHFKVYIDHSTNLQLPTRSESFGHLGYKIIDETQNNLLYHFRESGLWPPTKDEIQLHLQHRYIGDDTFENGTHSKIFIINQRTWSHSPFNTKRNATSSSSKTEIFSSLEYNEYKTNILPGIDYIRLGNIAGCSAIKHLEEPSILIEKFGGADYLRRNLEPFIAQLPPDNFFDFKIPNRITNHDRYKTLTLPYKNKR